MCGIFGIVGREDAYIEIKRGLERLAYRGYDSTGVSTIMDDKIETEKAIGHPENLPEVKKNTNIGIGHSRWASHGGITVENAHPHLSNNQKVSVVHNGIIENHEELRVELIDRGFVFYSETDTEVIPNLIQYYIDQGQDTIAAICSMAQKIRGAYAIAVINLDIPDTIFCARHGSPLCIGIGDRCGVVSSDINSLPSYVLKSSAIDNGKIVVLKGNSIDVRNLRGSSEELLLKKHEADISAYSLDSYSHYMEKEIFEQVDYLKNALAGRVLPKKSEIRLAGIESYIPKILEADEIIYTGCGSAFYAAQIGAMAMETIARKRCRVIPAGELQYFNAVITDKTVLIAVSQSGETADTIRCIQHFKNHGAITLGIVNVVNSSISSMVDSGIYIRAGQEVSVAATKSVLNQMATMLALAALVGSKKDLSQLTYEAIIKQLYRIPGAISIILGGKTIDQIRSVAKKYAHFENMVCISRGFLEPIAYETALKIKEISYIHAEGYSSSELKHGPLSLISPTMLTLALVDSGPMEDKILNNVNEVKSRGGPVIGVVEMACQDSTKNIFDDCIEIFNDSKLPALRTLEYLVVGQLLAYYLAVERKCPIDRPRNLAKSLTIE